MPTWMVHGRADSLELKTENTSSGKFRFLETMTTTSGNILQIEPFPKNRDALRETARQKFFNLKHSASYESYSTKLAAVISQFLSIS